MPQLEEASRSSGSRPAISPIKLQLVTTHPETPWFAVSIIVFAALVRVLVSVSLGLSDDESWYWALGQNPSMSYFVHPPLSMWMIAFTTKILGNSLLGVRLSSILCAGVGSYFLTRLAAKMGWWVGASRTAFFAFVTPLFFFGAILSGPDLPLFMAWTGAFEASYELWSNKGANPKAWLRLGVFTGLALLSKYTGVLIFPIVGLWILFNPAGRKTLRTCWPYLALAIAVLMFIPVLYWNSKNDWASFRFQFLERHSGSQLSLKRWAVFWITQILLFGPALTFGWFALLKKAFRPHQHRAVTMKFRFLALWSFIPGVIFFIQPLFGAFKIHWALCAYLPVMVYWAGEKLTGALKVAMIVTVLFSGVGLGCFYYPVLASFVSAEHDVTNDFYGWSDFGVQYSKLAPALRSVPLVSNRYQISSQASFALGSREQIRIIPHAALDLADWGGGDRLPKEFIYVSDNRYHDNPVETYPTHRCQALAEFKYLRHQILAKTIRLELCKAR